MNIKNLLCVVSAVALFGSVTAQAQGLTDLAKAEKKRRAQVQKSGGATKVYTESDRNSGVSEPMTAADATAAPGAPGAAPAAAGGGTSAKGEVKPAAAPPAASK